VKNSLKATEFWLTVVAFGTAFWLMNHDWVHDGVYLMIGSLVAYAISRGAAKAGYGKAINRPNQTRI
jgi:hypothetical protein